MNKNTRILTTNIAKIIALPAPITGFSPPLLSKPQSNSVHDSLRTQMAEGGTQMCHSNFITTALPYPINVFVPRQSALCIKKVRARERSRRRLCGLWRREFFACAAGPIKVPVIVRTMFHKKAFASISKTMSGFPLGNDDDSKKCARSI